MLAAKWVAEKHSLNCYAENLFYEHFVHWCNFPLQGVHYCTRTVSVILTAVSQRWDPPRSPDNIRTRGVPCSTLTNELRYPSWSTPQPAELPHSTEWCPPAELCPTLSYATPRWAMPHPAELGHTPFSHAIPHWGTPHPSEICRWAAPPPHWVTPHPAELRRTLMSYARTHWATPHPTPAVLVHVRLGKGFTLYTIPDPSSTGGLTSL